MSEPSTTEARGRRNVGRLYLVLNVCLLVGIAFMVNYLAFRHYTRWDWTDESIYTLSDRTERVVRGLSQPVTIYVLLSRNEPEQAEVRNILTRYQALGNRVQVRYLDPLLDPRGYDDLVRRFHLAEATEEMQQEGVVPLTDVAVVVASGERHWELRRDDLVRQSYGEETGNLTELDVEAERAITGAILEVVHGEPTRLCFTTGHGERPLDGGPGSLAGFIDELRHENVESIPLDLREADEIELRSPNGTTGCDAVAVVDPAIVFDDTAIERLRSYLRRGGNVLMALDPMPRRGEASIPATGFEDMLGDLGIRVGRDVVIELDEAMIPARGGDPILFYLVNDFGEHPLTERVRTLRPDMRGILVSRARSVTPADERAQTLIRTSDRSYGETDPEAGDLGTPGADDTRGPVSLGVATQFEQSNAEEGEEPHGGRLVVLGDADILSGGLVQLANADFVRAVVGWLTERDALISISRRTVERPAISSQGDELMLFVRVVVLIPLAFVFLGVAVWWNRRQ